MMPALRSKTLLLGRVVALSRTGADGGIAAIVRAVRHSFALPAQPPLGAVVKSPSCQRRVTALLRREEQFGLRARMSVRYSGIPLDHVTPLELAPGPQQQLRVRGGALDMRLRTEQVCVRVCM